MEIERKFLLSGDGWRNEYSKCVEIVQGYLLQQPHGVLRVRIAGDRAYLTLKSRSTALSCHEFEYSIPVADAEALIANFSSANVIRKTRYFVEYGGFVWEIDEFHGDNAGLIVAEIELSREDEQFEHPPWLGEEVTHDPRYLNSSLAENPFCSWQT